MAGAYITQEKSIQNFDQNTLREETTGTPKHKWKDYIKI
jgi:hypothetical protein